MTSLGRSENVLYLLSDRLPIDVRRLNASVIVRVGDQFGDGRTLVDLVGIEASSLGA